MTVTKILIRLQTLESANASSGTADPLYLGVITKQGGREFPLRYVKGGLNVGSNEALEFGINNTDLPPGKQIYNSGAGGFNNINAYPLYDVERVYLRKEPVRPGSDSDDAVGVYHVAAFLTDIEGQTTDWSNRNLSGGSGPSPFWLGNEFGQIVYLNPD